MLAQADTPSNHQWASYSTKKIARRTQCIRAQYQASTRKGNVCRSLLKRRFRKPAVLGVWTTLLRHRSVTCLSLHLLSCEGSREGDNNLLPCIDSVSLASDSSWSCTDAARQPAACGEQVLSRARLIQAAPKRSVTTARGSKYAPASLSSDDLVRTGLLDHTAGCNIKLCRE